MMMQAMMQTTSDHGICDIKFNYFHHVKLVQSYEPSFSKTNLQIKVVNRKYNWHNFTTITQLLKGKKNGHQNSLM